MNISPEELRIETNVEAAPAQKTGGQHVGKITAGVRITHAASGLQVMSDYARSQKANLDVCTAMIERGLEALNKKHRTPVTHEQAQPQPGSLWLVVVECRYNVVAVCLSGKGFYIPGQEPCWEFSHATDWIKEIKPGDYD